MEDLNSMVIVIFGRPAWFELMFENAMLTHSHKVSGCLASAHIVPWKQSWKGNRRTYSRDNTQTKSGTPVRQSARNAGKTLKQ
jgi:hypothetical protein